MICVPWHAWYGDHDLQMSFPPSWKVQAHWPDSAPDIGPEGIEEAFNNPIGAPPLEELARGRRRVAIAVDDISRPTPAARLLPPLLRRLEEAGVDLDRVRVVLGTGTHAPMMKEAILKKIGQLAADRLDVHNNFPYDNLVDLGTSQRGTPVHICRYFAEADLKIGIGCITPHGGPGFGGGAKVVIPGVAGIETIASMHRPGRLRTGLIDVEHNELRAEIEHMVRDRVGLDCIVNAVINARRGIAGLFVGDMVGAHRAGVRLARRVYATTMPVDAADIAICNAYPKDTDFLQAGMGMNPLNSSGKRVVKEGGTVVLITASPEGRGYHALYGPGMRYDRRRGLEDEKVNPCTAQGDPIAYFAPHVTAADARCTALYRRWEELIAHLRQVHGDQATVSVFPCGSIQLARESVLDADRFAPADL